MTGLLLSIGGLGGLTVMVLLLTCWLAGPWTCTEPAAIWRHNRVKCFLFFLLILRTRQRKAHLCVGSLDGGCEGFHAVDALCWVAESGLKGHITSGSLLLHVCILNRFRKQAIQSRVLIHLSVLIYLKKINRFVLQSVHFLEHTHTHTSWHHFCFLDIPVNQEFSTVLTSGSNFPSTKWPGTHLNIKTFILIENLHIQQHRTGEQL